VYRWVDHTAELELAIAADQERDVFEDALKALAELLGTAADAGGRDRREIAAMGGDRPALLAAWLEELVFLAETEGYVATSLESLELDEHGLRGIVVGVLDDPPPLVKAVTYHRLSFEREGSRYVARVVLDV
jgi:SHS2 domain-containing protein